MFESIEPYVSFIESIAVILGIAFVVIQIK